VLQNGDVTSSGLHTFSWFFRNNANLRFFDSKGNMVLFYFDNQLFMMLCMASWLSTGTLKLVLL